MNDEVKRVGKVQLAIHDNPLKNCISSKEALEEVFDYFHESEPVKQVIVMRKDLNMREEELLEIERRANELGILNCLIIDNGTTEFNGVPTKTCIALGPDYSARIDLITKELKLL